MADGQDDTLKHTVFSSWHGTCLKMKAEKDIRRRYDDQLAMFEAKFFECKAQQVQSLRSMMARMCYEENEAAVRDAFVQWTMEVAKHKAEGDTAEELKKVQAKLAMFADSA